MAEAEEYKRECIRKCGSGWIHVPFMARRYQRLLAEERELPTKIKAIEESNAQNLRTKSELLGVINEKLTDFSLSERWWDSIRSWIENATSGKAENVVIVLSKLDSKNWRVTGWTNSKKDQKKIVINFVEE